MDRLTVMTDKGAALVMGGPYESEQAVRDDLMERYKVAVARLSAYEDTGLTPERVAELSKAEKDGRLVVLPGKAKRTPHDEKIDALKSAVGKYCSKFMQMQTYGKCRASCPFHAIGNHGQAMCSDRFIEENPEKVAKILGIEWEAEAALEPREV